MTEKDHYSPFSDDVLRKAEELASSISADVSIDRRGEVKEFAGVVSNLADPASKPVRVRVAVSRDNDWLMLISEKPLQASERVLLVYRPESGPDIRKIGHHGISRPGMRKEDWQSNESRFFVAYHVTRSLPPAERRE